ncbi:DNA-directed RNA polymerase subunit alpha [Mycoplasma testudineum]|uniref:DNA-directed RNA polymerase subunit alpha n=1 Tax=Mycoplasma testudineum TaxID=244584 RepID=A0A4R6IGT1_9MOLU|nr:DNA-directed RNA polymerase subunit alpha [Mycoplasma testudineum]OYD27166.1 DNA-directed RNA polymerase subunit alpha [Mycoplasma testudineum]TDO21076.1 DNA-directed RNA polymerase subunit alpha [Mycoplasma testudineum]
MRKMTKISYNENKAKRENDYVTTLEIKPLERGFASTIGTALRRTMLSSITSLAAFAIKIKGLEHEFSTIKGVVEDVQSIILNMKNVYYNYDSSMVEEGIIYKGTIDAKGTKILAGDIKFESDIIKVLNADQIIATISGESKFQMEVFVRADRGYVDFEANKAFIDANISNINSSFTKGQLIAIDSDFSPVKKVAIHTTEINTSSVHIEEKLEIELQTNGTISAKEVMAQASQILIGHFQIIGNIENLDSISIFEEYQEKADSNSNHNKDIKDLGLTVRSTNALQRHGLNKLSDLEQLTEDDLSAVKNLGKKSVEEIISVLGSLGIEIKKGEEL